ncbi:TlyA family rRNA (cytidine-2'-O)-methyltransferase [Candidatus Dependentiae bacterium]|nr:TlyA family rRNA (cytidine-2'-O)-methyltransferase [Candidatus Dependentiae bacterium]
MKVKKRLDLLAQEKYPQFTRNQIQSWILQGKVLVDDKVVNKAGAPTWIESKIELNVDEPKYVSRAGFKLEKALDHFNVDVKNLIVLDAGISTGGFTDCLLQRGAKKVYGIDVGYGQVHEKLLKDDRLVLMERTNLRKLEMLPDKVDLVTLDLSFISILKVMPAVIKLIKPNAKIITLIKPQFEAGKENVGRGGVVKDPKVHEAVIEKIKDGMKEFGFKMIGVIESPILGATSGNKEFLALFEK